MFGQGTTSPVNPGDSKHSSSINTHPGLYITYRDTIDTIPIMPSSSYHFTGQAVYTAITHQKNSFIKIAHLELNKDLQIEIKDIRNFATFLCPDINTLVMVYYGQVQVWKLNWDSCETTLFNKFSLFTLTTASSSTEYEINNISLLNPDWIIGLRAETGISIEPRVSTAWLFNIHTGVIKTETLTKLYDDFTLLPNNTIRLQRNRKIDHYSIDHSFKFIRSEKMSSSAARKYSADFKYFASIENKRPLIKIELRCTDNPKKIYQEISQADLSSQIFWAGNKLVYTQNKFGNHLVSVVDPATKSIYSLFKSSWIKLFSTPTGLLVNVPLTGDGKAKIYALDDEKISKENILTELNQTSLPSAVNNIIQQYYSFSFSHSFYASRIPSPASMLEDTLANVTQRRRV